MKTRLERLCDFHNFQGGTIHDFNRQYNTDFLKMHDMVFEDYFKFTPGIERISDFLKTIRDADDRHECKYVLMDIGCNMIQASKLLHGFKNALKFSKELRMWVKRTLIENCI